MKSFFQSIYLLLLMVFLCTILTGCFPNTPDVESVEEHFRSNQEDIQIVVDFLVSMEHPSVYINTTDSTVLVDLERIEIEDEKVNAAIKQLLEDSIFDTKQYYNFADKTRNAIHFGLWCSAQGVECGVAYSINGEDLPLSQFCTEIVPLSEPGWYYYVDDYNEWRVGKRPQIEGLIPSPTQANGEIAGESLS